MDVDAILRRLKSERFIACRPCRRYTKVLRVERRRFGSTLVDVYCTKHRGRAVVDISDLTVEDSGHFYIWEEQPA